MFVLWFSPSGSHWMTPTGCRRHRSPWQHCPRNPASWPKTWAEEPEAELEGWTEDARTFSSHNPASTFSWSSWLSFLIFSSVRMLSVFPLSSISSLSAHCLCHSIVRLAPKGLLHLLRHLPPAPAQLHFNIQRAHSSSCKRRPHLWGLCVVCLNCLPELEIFPAPIFWSHAWRLQICRLYISLNIAPFVFWVLRSKS